MSEHGLPIYYGISLIQTVEGSLMNRSRFCTVCVNFVGSGIVTATAGSAIDMSKASSIDTLQSAIDSVFSMRAKLGAYQNRLTIRLTI